MSIRPGFAINPPVPLPEEPLGVSEVTEDRPKPGKVIENILYTAIVSCMELIHKKGNIWNRAGSIKYRGPKSVKLEDQKNG